MYVCVCAALNEKKVNAALEAGARSPAAVFKHHGAALQCGKCVGMMREMAAACEARRQCVPPPIAANDAEKPGAPEHDVAYGVAAE